MKYEWLDSYCQSKAGAIKEFKEEWNAIRYLIGDKMFALQGTDKEGKAIITLKLEPALGALLRSQHKDIIPGYYMNKEHWNSLYLEGVVPDKVLQDMVDKSYGIVFGALSKKAQKEITGEPL